MRGSRILFEDASFQLHAGQKLGLTGANGCGKSSLFALILGELETDHGEVSFPAGYRIAHVSQESPSSDQSALDYVMDGDAELRDIQASIRQAESGHDDIRLHQAWERLEAIDGYRAEARAGQLLHGLGFSATEMQQPVREFSGGWRMRLNLAQALMCRSDMLLLDEPTNHLDLPAIIWLESWLQRYAGVLLLISHDRDFLDGVCNRIAHIEHQGLKTYGGNYSQFETVRAMQLSQQQALFEAQQSEIKHIQSYVDRFRYKASKARQAQSRLKMLERMQKIAPAHVDSPFHFRFLSPERQPQHLLHLERAQLGYGDRVVLQDVDVAIQSGMRLGLLGVNGAGKSTLVKALADGSTLLQGERVIHKDTRIGYFAQHQMDLLDASRSPLDHLLDLDRSKPEQELRNYLGGFDFRDERIFEPVGPFSGGEKARLVLALLIRQRPNLLLLDEPTNHLDLEMRQALSLALADFEGALIVIAHDRHLLRSVCDELLIVHDGGVEPFDQTLDDYPAWLAQQERAQVATSNDSPALAPQDNAKLNKKEQRQFEARRRDALKPLLQAVKKAEEAMARLRMEIELVEKKLHDDTLYSNPARREELTALVQQQAQARQQLESAEETWLQASEALEQANAEG